MELTNSNIVLLGRNFSGLFFNQLALTQSFKDRIATTVPSTTAQNDYGFLKQIPTMREWIGDREAHNLAAWDYSVKNKTWEDTIAVGRDNIMDDNLGIFTTAFQALGESAKKHPDLLLSTLMAAGTSTVCYDSQNFFDTAHPGKDKNGAATTFSNYSASGMALTPANAMTVRSTMLSIRGDAGLPIANNPRLLVVPPALEPAAITCCSASIISQVFGSNTAAAGISNVAQLAGVFDYLMIPELAGDDTTWYLLDVGRVLKPFIFQSREALNFVAKTQWTDDNVSTRNEFEWFAHARYNVGVGLWQLAYKAVA